MEKYRITIENLEGGDYTEGKVIECDGFAILANREEDNDFSEVIHNISRFDLAIIIAQSKTIYPASLTARGILEAEKAEHERNGRSIMDGLSDLIGGLGK